MVFDLLVTAFLSLELILCIHSLVMGSESWSIFSCSSEVEFVQYDLLLLKGR